ncbi:MAG: hypothetical protein K0R92_3538 [Lachnospiraceae bacterium]|jgi:hypothetical protein|nr:hypothetical protein [Lachnospiraceae bacterium]
MPYVNIANNLFDKEDNKQDDKETNTNKKDDEDTEKDER